MFTGIHEQQSARTVLLCVVALKSERAFSVKAAVQDPGEQHRSFRTKHREDAGRTLILLERNVQDPGEQHRSFRTKHGEDAGRTLILLERNVQDPGEQHRSFRTKHREDAGRNTDPA